jgi:predicted flap endonuclease-1-like 5' DNA nuclease
MTKITYTGPAYLWRSRAYGGLTVKRDETVDVDDDAADYFVSEHDFVMGERADSSTFEFDDTADIESSDSDDDALDDFDAIDGVGPATEEALYDADYTTYADVANASDDELLAIDGVGRSAFDALRNHIEPTDTEDSAFDIGG